MEIKTTRFYDMDGKYAFQEKFTFKRLYAVGDVIVEKNVEYQIKRVAVAGTVQVVNIQKTGDQCRAVKSRPSDLPT
jgi:hypothetical protein